MRLVQIPVADRPECIPALQYAFQIAARTGADVRGFHLRAHQGDPTNAMAGLAFQHRLTSDIDWSASEREAITQTRAAAKLFEDAAGSAGLEMARKPRKDLAPVALWQERVGTPHHVMPVVGPTADLMVVSRPAKTGGKKATAILLEALMHSHRPVLIVPDKARESIGRHILVAWNSSAESARLVHAILPLLKAADKVTFASVGKGGGSGPNVQEMMRYLAHHGVNAENLYIKMGKPEIELLRAMKSTGADLLAMGAYSHRRMSETLFGGVTNHMLFKASKPVLMLHS